ncbi:MAG: hypothetical protein KC455_07060 [Carnobacterium sp.]|nr:hypothetical protein [Carnobacterium sp.]
MDNKELPIIPVNDFPEYNADTQDYLWPVIVKYHEQPEIKFFTSKSEVMKAFRLLDAMGESDSNLPIAIGDRTFKQDKLKSLHFEGRTYAFYNQE